MLILSLALIALTDFSSSAFAASTASTFFNVAPEPAPIHSAAELNKIFTQGVGPYSPTMKDKLYPYLLPRNSVFNAPLYNGCYDSNNNRLGDLNSVHNCAAVIAEHPGVSIFRLFLGYKVGCSGEMSGPDCQDMSLSMNCQLTQVADLSGVLNPPTPVRECSEGYPIIHKAKANSDETTAFIGCFPGADGTTYPTCTLCANGTYNDTTGANLVACKQCTVLAMTGAETMPNAATQPTTFDTHTSGGNTSGAIAGAQCWIKSSDSWTCATGFSKTADNQACVAKGECALSLNITPTNPTSPTATDGKIVASYSGETGAVSAFAITGSPSIQPNPLSGATGTFAGLGNGTYKVSVTDASCTSATNIVLGIAPPPPKVVKCVASYCHLNWTHDTKCYTDGTNSGAGPNMAACMGETGPSAAACQAACGDPLPPKVVKCYADFCHLGKEYKKTCYTDGTSTGAVLFANPGASRSGPACNTVEENPNASNVLACDNPVACPTGGGPPPCTSTNDCENSPTQCVMNQLSYTCPVGGSNPGQINWGTSDCACPGQYIYDNPICGLTCTL